MCRTSNRVDVQGEGGAFQRHEELGNQARGGGKGGDSVMLRGSSGALTKQLQRGGGGGGGVKGNCMEGVENADCTVAVITCRGACTKQGLCKWLGHASQSQLMRPCTCGAVLTLVFFSQDGFGIPAWARPPHQYH